MDFESILYQDGYQPRHAVQPEYFRDLNLDQIIVEIIAGKEEYDLRPLFYDCLSTRDAIAYRHDVFRELERKEVALCFKIFSAGMQKRRADAAQAQKLHYKYQKERWLLHASEVYCETILKLQADLSQLQLSSPGIIAFRGYVDEYLKSSRFAELHSATIAISADLAQVSFLITVLGNGLNVRMNEPLPDYSAEILDAFKKFQQGDAKTYLATFPEHPEMNHIEATVLEFVARLNPEVFFRLDEFCHRYPDHPDPILMRFDREIHFYISYLDYILTFRRMGLNFSYPTMSAEEKEVHNREGFDLALAAKLLAVKQPVVCNDFYLNGKERIIVISGPNQGGKTTFARTFGQLHHLASLGCLVPGQDTKLFLFDAMFTHFEREETITTLNGKLQDDLLRIHAILEAATPRSLIIMNEIFNSTSLQDAVFLARKVIDRIIDLDCLCICVSFLDELASLSEKTVSMVSTVSAGDLSSRTFKVLRRPADGKSYALSIAEKYRLTYECITERLQRSEEPTQRVVNVDSKQ